MNFCSATAIAPAAPDGVAPADANLADERETDRSVACDDDFLGQLVFPDDLDLQLIAGMQDGACRRRLCAHCRAEREHERKQQRGEAHRQACA